MCISAALHKECPSQDPPIGSAPCHPAAILHQCYQTLPSIGYTDRQEACETKARAAGCRSKSARGCRTAGIPDPPRGLGRQTGVTDRKSVVLGKSVDLGGRRIIKKKKQKNAAVVDDTKMRSNAEHASQHGSSAD